MLNQALKVPETNAKTKRDINDTVLFKKAKNGCSDSRNHIISKHAKLVFSVVNKFTSKNDVYEDLVQNGFIYLMKAVDNFDPDRGFAFSTFAYSYVQNSIKTYLLKDNRVKIPKNIKLNQGKIKKYVDSFILNKKREPTIKEISKDLEIKEKDVTLGINSSQSVFSLDYDLNESSEEKDVNLKDTLSNNLDLEEDSIRKMILKQSMERLNNKEKYIIQLRYFQDKTQSEVGNKLNLSQVQVSRVEKKALNKLKQHLIK